MESNKKTMINGVEVDTEKAQRLIKKVIIKEKRNLSTKQYKTSEMVKQIKAIIEEDVKCY